MALAFVVTWASGMHSIVLDIVEYIAVDIVVGTPSVVAASSVAVDNTIEDSQPDMIVVDIEVDRAAVVVVVAFGIFEEEVTAL